MNQVSATEETAHAPQLSVVVPVYNEEGNLLHLYERLTGALDAFGRSYELLFIDDGSKDASFDRLSELHAKDERVRVVRFARNFGQQMAVQAGLDFSSGDAVVLIDADLQTHPEDIPTLVERLDDGYDIVYGVRERRRDPLFRRLGSWCMSHFLYRITGIDVPDSASGFLALDRRFVDSLKLYGERSKYFSGLFAWLSYGRWAFVPVNHSPRQSGDSKYSLFKLVGLTLNFVCSFSELPLRLATYAGGLFAGLGVLEVMIVSVLWLVSFGPPAADVWILAGVLAVFSGVQLLCLGIMGEYLARIYTEVKERPPFVVREVLGHD